mgnify:CR=1 FL=1
MVGAGEEWAAVGVVNGSVYVSGLCYGLVGVGAGGGVSGVLLVRVC